MTVISGYEEQLSQVRQARIRIEQRLSELRDRQRLDDAFIYRNAIDQQTYREQRDRLRETVALAELELHETAGEELDVDGILGFAEAVFEDAGKLWKHAEPHQKQKLQRALYPEGLQFDGERIGTAVTCLAFYQLQQIDSGTEGMASRTGSANRWTFDFNSDLVPAA